MKLASVAALARGEASIVTCELSLVVTNAQGRVDHGVVSRKKLTIDFVDLLVRTMAGESLRFDQFRYHQVGTDGTNENNADHDLQAAIWNRFAGDQGSENPGGSTRTYVTNATIVTTSPGTLREHAIFNAVEGGCMLDRSVFWSPVACGLGDTLQFTYRLLVSAEG